MPGKYVPVVLFTNVSFHNMSVQIFVVCSNFKNVYQVSIELTQSLTYSGYVVLGWKHVRVWRMGVLVWWVVSQS